MSTPELLRLGVGEWANQLEGVTGEQVKHGLDNWAEDWPPSSAEFAKLCKGESDAMHGSPAYKTFISLPKPPVNKKLGLEALTAMKKNLK